MFNLPLSFDSAPEIGTLLLIVALSGLVAYVLVGITKAGWSFVRKSKKMAGQPAAWDFVLRLASVMFGAGAACVLGSGFGWWAVLAGVVGGGFATWIVKKIKARVRE